MKKKRKKKNMNKNSIIELMLPYMLLNMMSGDLSNIGKPNKRKKKKENVEELIEVLEEGEEDMSDGEEEEDMSDDEEEEDDEEEMSDDEDGEEEEDEEIFNTPEEESSSEESEFEYDEYDDTFIELIENDINEDEEIARLSDMINSAQRNISLMKTDYSFLLKNFRNTRKPENNLFGLGINLTNLFFRDSTY